MADTLYAFLERTQHADIPQDVTDKAKLWLMDLIGVAAAGHSTSLSRIIADHAVDHFGAGKFGATMIFDGRAVSPSGMALAGGMSIDSIDAHDGFRPCKGHVGCALLPALLAFAQNTNMSGTEFLTLFVMGYELGSRAGQALHATAPDYHASGAWMAPVIAALGARALGLSRQQTRHAIGIAEYHGPRSQMMRVIDHPSMLKDSSGWGAMTGVSASYLAADGFTGAPAISFEGDIAAPFFEDLGDVWLTPEQYYKPYPVCRWAQPAITATLGLRNKHGLTSEDVGRIEVATFHEALRLATARPQNTEEAQYSTSYPTAAAMVRGVVGVDEISETAFSDPEIRRLSEGMTITEEDIFNENFPEVRMARVTLHLKDGSSVQSGITTAAGDPEAPPPVAEMGAKYHSLADPVIGVKHAQELYKTIFDTPFDLTRLIQLLTSPVPRPTLLSEPS